MDGSAFCEGQARSTKELLPLRRSSNRSGRASVGIKDLPGFFELLKLALLGLQLLFRLGDLGLQLLGLLQDHLHGCFLLPRLAALAFARGRLRFGRFWYWHRFAP